jgi:hypothetical protein
MYSIAAQQADNEQKSCQYSRLTPFRLFHKLVWSVVALVSSFCCQASDQNFAIGEILTNPPALTIEYTRDLVIEPVVFKDHKEAEKFAELVKSGKAKFRKGSMSCLFYFNRKDKVFSQTNSTGESASKAGIKRSAQGCCEQGCWVELPNGLMVDTNQFTFDSVVSGRNGGFFWNPYRMVSEVLRFGMFELDETTAHFNLAASRWEGKSESGDLVAFSVLPQPSGSAIWIEYSVPKLSIKRHIELHFDRSATLDLGFPSSVVVFADANGAMRKYCQYDIKSLKLDKQQSHPECTLTTILSSSQPFIIYNGGKPLFRGANGVVAGMEPTGSAAYPKTVKVKALLFIFAAVSCLAVFLLMHIKNKQIQ